MGAARTTQLIAVSLGLGLATMLNEALAESPSSDLGSTLGTVSASRSRPIPTDKFESGRMDTSSGFSPVRLDAVLSGLESDKNSWRGAAEVRLYAETAPGVARQA
jgi:hypothetical protein